MLPVGLLAVALLPPMPPVVACTVMGSEHLYARQWVEYHLAIGVSRIYLFDNPPAPNDRGHQLGPPDMTQSGLRGLYPKEIVTITNCSQLYPAYKLSVRRVTRCQLPTCSAMVADDYGINTLADPSSTRHVWIMLLDIDEYITPINPILTLPQVLMQYEQRGQYSLILQKVWFGSGSASHQSCITAPMVARFTHYGTSEMAKRYKPSRLPRMGKNALDNLTAAGKSVNTLHVNWGSAKPVFSTRVMPKLKVDAAGASQLHGTHCVTGLTVKKAAGADVSGPAGLVLSHYKPRSQEEFVGTMKWNDYLQHKFGSSAQTSALATFETMRLQTSGGTHAIHLDRMPTLCRRSSFIADALQKCKMHTLCIDCIYLKASHGCAPATSTPANSSPNGAKTHHRQAIITGKGRAAVVAALRAANSSLTILPEFAIPLRRGVPIIHTDISDSGLICSQPCHRLHFLDPLQLDAPTVASRVKLLLAPDDLEFPLPFMKSGIPCMRGNSRKPRNSISHAT